MFLSTNLQKFSDAISSNPDLCLCFSSRMSAHTSGSSSESASVPVQPEAGAARSREEVEEEEEERRGCRRILLVAVRSSTAVAVAHPFITKVAGAEAGWNSSWGWSRLLLPPLPAAGCPMRRQIGVYIQYLHK